MSEGFLTGRMLIAMPGIDDPRFDRAVILMCVHDHDHAMGLTVNHPVEGLTVPDLLDKLNIKAEIELPDALVLIGGPVESERGFVLHTDDYVCPTSSIAVGAGLKLTATREVLEAMGSQDQRPRRSMLALGYASWNTRSARTSGWSAIPTTICCSAKIMPASGAARWARSASISTACPPRPAAPEPRPGVTLRHLG